MTPPSRLPTVSGMNSAQRNPSANRCPSRIAGIFHGLGALLAFLVALGQPPLKAAEALSPIPPLAGEPPAVFASAEPVWAARRERERNLTLGFHTAFPTPPSGRALLRLAASSLYRVHVNGRFAGHGPARAGHGFQRVDEIDLAPLHQPAPATNAAAIAGNGAAPSTLGSTDPNANFSY